MDYCGLLWIIVDYCGLLWIIVDYCGLLWIIVDYCGLLWIIKYYGLMWIYVPERIKVEASSQVRRRRKVRVVLVVANAHA